MRRKNNRVQLRTITVAVWDQSERFDLQGELLPDRKESLRRAARLHDLFKAALEQPENTEPAHPVDINDCDLIPELYDFLNLDIGQYEVLLQTTDTADDFGLSLDFGFAVAGTGPGDGSAAFERS
jgi:hypothetical protein